MSCDVNAVNRVMIMNFSTKTQSEGIRNCTDSFSATQVDLCGDKSRPHHERQMESLDNMSIETQRTSQIHY